jgi:hypothetical protein
LSRDGFAFELLFVIHVTVGEVVRPTSPGKWAGTSGKGFPYACNTQDISIENKLASDLTRTVAVDLRPSARGSLNTTHFVNHTGKL